MERSYNTTFHIGQTKCTLVSIHPFRTAATVNRPYHEHQHHCFEIHAVSQGACTFLCDNRTMAVRSGELLLLPPQLYHKEILASADSSRLALSFSLKLSPEEKSKESLLFYKTFVDLRQPVILKTDCYLSQILSQLSMLSSMDNTNFLVQEKAKVTCGAFLLTLFENIQKDQCVPVTDAYASVPAKEYVIDNFFARNFKSGASKEALAKKLNVSTRQLHRILVDAYGKNYRKKSCETRLQVALGFLLDTDKSIAKIAQEVGYSTPENFSTFIKNATGKTPGQIRREGL